MAVLPPPEAKATELRTVPEPIISTATRGDVHARRLVARQIPDADVVSKLFEEIGPKYSERAGGYTRVLKLGHRSGDGADLAIIELVD